MRHIETGSELYVNPPRSIRNDRTEIWGLAVMKTIGRICCADQDAMQAPEIQTMYNVPLPVSALRTRMRQEFERQRYVNKLPVVDVLLFRSAADYQVRALHRNGQVVYEESGQDDGPCRTRSSHLPGMITGDDELLAADYAHHVVLQGGELPRRSAATHQLHGGFPGGKDHHPTSCRITLLTRDIGPELEEGIELIFRVNKHQAEEQPWHDPWISPFPILTSPQRREMLHQEILCTPSSIAHFHAVSKVHPSGRIRLRHDVA